VPNAPLRIVSAASSSPFYTDPPSMLIYAGINASTASYSLFFALKDNPNDMDLIQAGETAVLKSHTTGLFCKLAFVPGVGLPAQGLECSEPSQDVAAVVNFTGKPFPKLPLLSAAGLHAIAEAAAWTAAGRSTAAADAGAAAAGAGSSFLYKGTPLAARCRSVMWRGDRHCCCKWPYPRHLWHCLAPADGTRPPPELRLSYRPGPELRPPGPGLMLRPPGLSPPPCR
jgi:hypothetical protein